MKGATRMLTFKFGSEKPYYQNGQLVKRVMTKEEIRVSNLDCAVLGWTAVRLLGKLTFALIFNSNPYRLP
jgi:hypothetical protein